MLLAWKIWNDVEILHTITVLLFIKNLDAYDLIISCFSLIKFTLMHILLVLQGIQKVLLLVVIEKLWFSAEFVAIYDFITPMSWRCVNRIELFGSLILLTRLCGTATALLSLLERSGNLNYFIVDLIAIIKSETVGAVLNNIIWVVLNCIHFPLILVISFYFVVIQFCALLVEVLRWLLDGYLAANIKVVI